VISLAVVQPRSRMHPALQTASVASQPTADGQEIKLMLCFASIHAELREYSSLTSFCIWMEGVPAISIIKLDNELIMGGSIIEKMDGDIFECAYVVCMLD
jgi:hypothetical protein